MKLLYLFISIFCFNCTYSQLAILQDNSGKPFFESNKNVYNGSPYMFETWVQAKVFTKKNSNIFYSINVNYHIPTGKIHFLENGNAMEFLIFINKSIMQFNNKEIELIHSSNFNLNEQFYFENLYSKNNVFLLKKHIKSLSEQSVYNSADKTFTYNNGVEYYLFKEGLKKIKLNKEGFLQLLDYFQLKNNFTLNFKNENDWLGFLKNNAN